MRPYFIILLVLLGLDQLSKYLILSLLDLYEVRPLIPGFFNLVYVTNKGAAFSMFASVDSPLRHYFFVTVNSAAFLGLTIAAWKMSGQHLLYRVSFAMIGAGAVGNLIDRLRFGAVIDFLDFYVGSYHWPAFNVADSAIFVGVALLFVMNVIEMKKEKNGSDE
ncbi:MAG: signal peptidase II [Desulfofustis sp.]|nr:signal peptidase II [Desulfofustis sp.]NNK14740.1 signal peptidase II [Desulfofustis sp.]